VMISTRSVGLVIDTVVCLTLDKWETVSGQFGGYLTHPSAAPRCTIVSPITITSIRVRRKQSSASFGSHTTGSFSLNEVLSTIGTPVSLRKAGMSR
jgi:hypothetical protein